MLVVFPIDDETKACIAWGRVSPDRENGAVSPVTITPFDNGTNKFFFRMTVSSKIVGGAGKKEQWKSEEANVSVWAKNYDQRGNKLCDVVKLLRSQDPVIVFGRYRSRDWTDYTGATRTAHDIIADVVLPQAWIYDVILALFAQVIAKQAPPRLKEVKQAAPKQGQPVPQITHPTVMSEKDGWFD